MEKLLKAIKECTVCENHLPFNPNPVVQVHAKSKIVIIGQAPGLRVQNSGKPWDDLSGATLRRWLGVTENEFYDAALFALLPMGFCYPGKGKSGDLPPRKECAPLWHWSILNKMQEVKLVLLIGQYAQQYYLGQRAKGTLTENVKSYREFLPNFLPLVHPSPRNRIWQKKNEWFETELVPEIQGIIKSLLT